MENEEVEGSARCYWRDLSSGSPQDRLAANESVVSEDTGADVYCTRSGPRLVLRTPPTSVGRLYGRTNTRSHHPKRLTRKYPR
jgi:hypothetical protein